MREEIIDLVGELKVIVSEEKCSIELANKMVIVTTSVANVPKPFSAAELL